MSADSFRPDRLRDLGIGGLDRELHSLFRRAFASRAVRTAQPGFRDEAGQNLSAGNPVQSSRDRSPRSLRHGPLPVSLRRPS